GQPHNYAEELENPVRSVLESLAALPSTLVVLIKSTTNMPLYGLIARPEDGDNGPGWVWEETWTDRVPSSATLDNEVMRNHAGSRDVGVVHAGQDVDRWQHIPAEVNLGGSGRAEALSEGSISDVQADHIHKTTARDGRFIVGF
ncbi:unnamed protein product, partial [Pylaiella littoralis]